MRLVGDKFYLIKDRKDGEVVKAKYIGRQVGFECMVCGKGHNAYCFNVYHSDDEMDYETWAFGKEHLPEIIKEL